MAGDNQNDLVATEAPASTVAKPKWLRKLERESWQAELIISGAAILGSLQLPDLLEQAEVYCLLNFDRDTIYVAYIAMIYWRILIYSLIAAFVFHFVVRALWIGMVGLNSVYTEGFKPNKRFAEHYQEKLREEYGDIDGFIRRLDRLGSGVFGVSFATALVFFNFGLIGSLVVYLHSWLVSFDLPPRWILLGLGLLFLPVFLLSLGSMILQLKQFKNGKIARRYLWPIAHIVSRITYLVARRYVITSSNLVTSYHADNKSFGRFAIGGFIVFLVLVMATIFNARYTSYFIDPVYHRMGSDSTRLLTAYADDLAYTGIYVQPELDEVTRSSVSFWIPAPEREWVYLERQCNVPEASDELERMEQRVINRQRIIDCARRFYRISINGEEITDYSIKRQNRVNEAAAQVGFGVYAAVGELRPGPNLIEVVSSYPHDETGLPRITYTPFHFSPAQ
ncbi:hypothetical protein LEM8419_01396 [Neolewinella maritima]|uniref:Uncharacterized protein n=1 Tax=Neolewinella maritima TaxID=1383882 RepID=A0ABN8F5M8_9BACT|nr:hypothetical protein [Neolewinella maritima]CAH1000247.1 hypothetical protein LEM8419_01396 [Neolewinella maritima]